MDIKICKKCKKELPVNLFGNNKINKDGLEYRCKKCENERNKIKAKNQRKTYEGRCILLFRSYINNDKSKNLYNDLDIEFVKNVLQQPCFYCGSNKKIGLDRIDNQIGHIKTNVNPCCIFCNIVKSNVLTVEEMKLLGPILKNIQDTRELNNIPLIHHRFLKGLK